MVALALAVHAPSVGHDFVSFDDREYVYENDAVRGGLSLGNVAWAFGVENENKTYFHPLTWISLMAYRDLFGLAPWGFHLVNVLLHATASVLLLWILLVATGRAWPSAIAASLFAVHPLTVEAVAWVTERKTVLSSALGFAAILVYVRAAARGRPTWRRIGAVCALHLAGILAKPGLIVLPALLLVLDLWPLGRLRGEAGAQRRAALVRLVLEKVPIAAVSAAVLAAVLASSHPVRTAADRALPFGLRLSNAVASVPHYLLDASWPARLAVFHPFPAAVSAGAVAAGLAAILAVTAAAAALAGRAPAVAAGWAWFCIALGPYLGLYQMGLWPARADRFAYVPLAGLAFGVAFAGAGLLRGRAALTPAIRILASLAIVSLAAGALRQGRHWKDSVSLYRRAVEIEPGSGRMRYDLGAALMRTGHGAEAREQIEEAIRVEPTLALPRVLLATFLARDGNSAAAEAQYREVIRLDPGNYDAAFLLAETLRQSGRHEEAKQFYATVLKLAPPGEARLRQVSSWFAR